MEMRAITIDTANPQKIGGLVVGSLGPSVEADLIPPGIRQLPK
ncbi:hypothetical protein [Burkholderia cepacia]|nr:hypothetical protein [Burkholderia cepacia]QFS42437.1 hypothetical protein BURCE16_37010 [Burkholderia cepacia]